MNSKNEVIMFVSGCVCAAAVVIAIVAAFYNGANNSSLRYHAAMNECIQARGTWVPSMGNSGSCIINKP